MVGRRVQVRPAEVADVGRVAALFALYRQFCGWPHDEQAAAAVLRDRLDRGAR